VSEHHAVIETGGKAALSSNRAMRSESQILQSCAGSNVVANINLPGTADLLPFLETVDRLFTMRGSIAMLRVVDQSWSAVYAQVSKKGHYY
jgi:hypothetical protein